MSLNINTALNPAPYPAIHSIPTQTVVDPRPLQKMEVYIGDIVCLFVCLYFSLVIVYFVFGILALSQTHSDDLHQMCESSHLYAYMIYTLLSFLFYYVGEKGTTIRCFLFLESIKIGIACTWGSYELFFLDCIENIKPTLMWKTCFAHWLVYMSIGNGITLFLVAMWSLQIYEFLHDWMYGTDVQPNAEPVINPIVCEDPV